MEKRTIQENERIFKYLNNKCNQIIFKGLYDQFKTFDELKQNLELNNFNPTIFTQKIFTRIINQDFEKKELKFSTKAITSIINESVAKGFLKRWGEENKFLVTPEFLEYIKSIKNPFLKFDLETYEGAEIEIQTIECPYCKDQTKFPIDEGHYEINCEKCEKEFKIITGLIKNIEDATLKISEFQKETVQPTISLKMLIKTEFKSFNFYTAHPILIDKNDKVSLIYKKGWLFEKYSDMPVKVANLTSSEIYKL